MHNYIAVWLTDFMSKEKLYLLCKYLNGVATLTCSFRPLAYIIRFVWIILL